MRGKFSLLISTALTTSTALVSGAVAADLRMPVKAVPVAPPFSWNGCYIGGNVGWASVDVDQRVTVPGIDVFETDGSKSGFTGGAQAGCNYHYSPNWVIGIEGDINFLDVSRRRSFEFTGGGEDVVGSHATKLHWLVTLRGRLGFASGRTLFFVTGGLAVGEVKSSVSAVAEVGATFAGSSSDTRAGWALGGGIEHAFSDKISAKLEYLHFDLGSDKFNVNLVSGGVGGLTTLRASSGISGDIVRLGLNLKLN